MSKTSNGRPKPKANPGRADVELARRGSEGLGISLEANLPADAALTTKGANECVGVLDPAVMPFGVITLGDVMEELISEEINYEFDEEGAHVHRLLRVLDRKHLLLPEILQLQSR
ncbi:hypothetical protein F5050DRAFT_1709053 [Lentinula boryana]|uniref:CBS domain-containing protein n=1 Tax=Lentinula boryana TaxID=40481 RepID=A0ABQ8QPM1_9AGAR|nr:hypothetical protein F5050DRAFT_1709053 [Lentinula boryana]